MLRNMSALTFPSSMCQRSICTATGTSDGGPPSSGGGSVCWAATWNENSAVTRQAAGRRRAIVIGRPRTKAVERRLVRTFIGNLRSSQANAPDSLAGRGGHRASVGRRIRRIAAAVVRILGVRAHRQAARWTGQHLALTGGDAVLDPVLQQPEAIEAARNRPRCDALALAVDRRGPARQAVPRLRQHIEPRERVDGLTPHRVEDRLVVVELLA